MAETVVEVLAKFRADTADFNRRLTEVQSQLDALSKKTTDVSNKSNASFGSISGSLGKMATAFGSVAAVAGGALISIGVKSFMAAARVQELDVAINAVGKSTGLGYQAIADAATGIKSMGIEMQVAQRSALMFAQNNLKLADASKLARTAQDLAVLSGKNSTEEFQLLTYAVMTQRSELFKSAGVNGSVQGAYQAMAKSLGKSTNALTAQEKVQAAMNMALSEGAKVAGTYEAAMTSPGKVLRSFARITDDIQVSIGETLLNGFGPMIVAAYHLYKAFSELIVPGGALYPIIQALTAVFTSLAQPVTDAITHFTDFLTKMKPITTSVGDMGAQIQKYLPVIASLATAFATFAGGQLLQGIPVLGKFVGGLNPIATAILVLVATSPKLRDAFMNLLDSLKPMLGVLKEVAKFVGTVVNDAIVILGEAINALAGFIRSATKYISEHKTQFEVLAGVLVGVGAGILVYITVAKTIALVTKAWGAAQAALNIILDANPIGLIMIAVVALIGGMVVLWNHSLGFRKVMIEIGKVVLPIIGFIIKAVGVMAEAWLQVVTGPMRLMLKGLGFFVPAAKTAAQELDKMPKAVGSFFDTAAAKIDSFAGKLDKFQNSKITLPNLGGSEFTLPKAKETPAKSPAGKIPGVTPDTGPTAAQTAAAQALADMKVVLKKYNDFIQNDFVPGFQKDSSTAQDTVMKALDQLKNVFDEKAKGLKGQALLNLQEAYNKTDDAIRKFIPQAKDIGQQFEDLNTKIEETTKKLEEATKNRADAASAFAELLKKPFGEQSAINKAMSGAQATADSIIGMYDNIVQQIDKRYSGLDQTGRNQLVDYLTKQTQRLVDLSNKRIKVAKDLEKAQAALDKITQEQASFVDTAKSSMSGFATALVDLSKSDAIATIQVIKTSSGMVISQMGTSNNAIDSITKQLKDRLQTIKDFAKNIQNLVSRGVNKDYIKQLVGAGPEAGGATAAALSSATSAQLQEINTLYSGISDTAASYSDSMGQLFYGSGVAAAQGLVTSLTDQQAAIDAEMLSIVADITEKLKPLSDLGSNLGDDLIQGMLDKLNARKTELVTLAESIATAIAVAMANALAGIGVLGATVPPVTPTPTPKTKEATSFLDQANWNRTMNPSGGAYDSSNNGSSTTINTTINAKNVDQALLHDSFVDSLSKSLLGRR